MQVVVLSGFQSAYCGESLRQKADHLSPQINVGVAELQQAFNISTAVLSESNAGKMSRRKFLRGAAIVAIAAIVSPTFVTESIAGKLTQEEQKRFNEIRNRIRASEAAKEAPASYKLNKVDQEKDAMWKRIDKK